MHVLVTCKNEEDPIQNEGARVVTIFLPLYVCGEIFRSSRVANSSVYRPIMLNFELSPGFMIVLVTCKNEEDTIKNEEARVFTTLLIFQTPKGS